MDETFWSQQFTQFIFVLANNGHVVLLGTLGILAVSFGPIGRALAARLRSGTREAAVLEALKAELVELQERVDFSERAVAEVRRQLLHATPDTADHLQVSEESTPV